MIRFRYLKQTRIFWIIFFILYSNIIIYFDTRKLFLLNWWRANKRSCVQKPWFWFFLSTHVFCSWQVVLLISQWHLHGKTVNFGWKIKWFAPSRLERLQKIWAMCWCEGMFQLVLVCSADLDILCSKLFSLHVKFYSFYVQAQNFHPGGLYKW